MLDTAIVQDITVTITGTWVIGQIGGGTLTEAFDVMFKVITIVNADDLLLTVTPKNDDILNI